MGDHTEPDLLKNQQTQDIRNRTNQEHSPPGHGEEQLVEHHQVSKRRTDSRRRSLRCEPMEVEKPKIESLKPTEPIGFWNIRECYVVRNCTKRDKKLVYSNGLDFEKYSWTQNLQEVTVTIPVPSGTKSRSVACEIKKSRLRVGLKGQEPIIDGEFFNAVKPDDCFWNIEDQKFISVLLTKQDQMQWWKYCLKGEPEIDTQKVELESSKLSDLDPETEAALRR
uniref:CS domain-containing protein n=1 Tax=Brassica oleracea var. oleracea TaxID=109376 RepID=A0A0D3B9X0_BRAOL